MIFRSGTGRLVVITKKQLMCLLMVLLQLNELRERLGENGSKALPFSFRDGPQIIKKVRELG